MKLLLLLFRALNRIWIIFWWSTETEFFLLHKLLLCKNVLIYTIVTVSTFSLNFHFFFLLFQNSSTFSYVILLFHYFLADYFEGKCLNWATLCTLALTKHVIIGIRFFQKFRTQLLFTLYIEFFCYYYWSYLGLS